LTAARAAIDIGSNSLRLLVAEPDDGPTPWKALAKELRITRLAQDLRQTGRLHPVAIGRTVAALDEFLHIIWRHGLSASSTYAVATAAVREANNRDEFLSQVASATGLNVHVIDGRQEATMSLAGASKALDYRHGLNMLLFDIGGGSTEFVRAENRRLTDATSRKLGVVSLTESHLASDPPSSADYTAMIDETMKHLETVQAQWGKTKAPATLVGTAGTVTTLAALHLGMAHYDAERIDNLVISIDEFVALKQRLLCMTYDERASLPLVGIGRADLMVAGIAIVEAVMRQWHYRELVTVDAGLLEGAWLAGAT